MFDKVNSVTSTYKNKMTGGSWEYENIGAITVFPTKNGLRATLKDMDPMNADAPDSIFQVIVMQKDGEFFIKSDMFIEPEEEYPLVVTEQIDGMLVLLSEDEHEWMEICLFT